MTTAINSMKPGPTTVERVPDTRLCIWCGGEYRVSAHGADQCFCPKCVVEIPPLPRCAARIQWMYYADLSHRKDDPWPPTFPVIRRPELPPSAPRAQR